MKNWSSLHTFIADSLHAIPFDFKNCLETDLNQKGKTILDISNHQYIQF